MAPGLPSACLLEQPQGLAHKGQLLQVDGVQGLEAVGAADGRVQQRPLVVVNLKGDAKGGQRGEDVAAGQGERAQARRSHASGWRMQATCHEADATQPAATLARNALI